MKILVIIGIILAVLSSALVAYNMYQVGTYDNYTIAGITASIFVGTIALFGAIGALVGAVKAEKQMAKA